MLGLVVSSVLSQDIGYWIGITSPK